MSFFPPSRASLAVKALHFAAVFVCCPAAVIMMIIGAIKGPERRAQARELAATQATHYVQGQGVDVVHAACLYYQNYWYVCNVQTLKGKTLDVYCTGDDPVGICARQAPVFDN